MVLDEKNKYFYEWFRHPDIGFNYLINNNILFDYKRMILNDYTFIFEYDIEFIYIKYKKLLFCVLKYNNVKLFDMIIRYNSFKILRNILYNNDYEINKIILNTIQKDYKNIILTLIKNNSYNVYCILKVKFGEIMSTTTNIFPDISIYYNDLFVYMSENNIKPDLLELLNETDKEIEKLIRIEITYNLDKILLKNELKNSLLYKNFIKKWINNNLL
jgi:hypothetical protein